MYNGLARASRSHMPMEEACAVVTDDDDMAVVEARTPHLTYTLLHKDCDAPWTGSEIETGSCVESDCWLVSRSR
jgi:hypothetical protein